MQTLISIIIALIIFSVLVLIHEFGHFIVAKKCGVVVNEFSVGMGPRLLSRVAKSGTRYSIKALPLGGSCAMLKIMQKKVLLTLNLYGQEWQLLLQDLSLTLFLHFYWL